MTRTQAEEFKAYLTNICKDKGLWIDVHEVYKPDLKDVVITISVRITQNDQR